jgi:hypothetical protein
MSFLLPFVYAAESDMGCRTGDRLRFGRGYRLRRHRLHPRNQRRRAMGAGPAIEDLNGDSSHSTQGKAHLHAGSFTLPIGLRV